MDEDSLKSPPLLTPHRVWLFSLAVIGAACFIAALPKSYHAALLRSPYFNWTMGIGAGLLVVAGVAFLVTSAIRLLRWRRLRRDVAEVGQTSTVWQDLRSTFLQFNLRAGILALTAFCVLLGVHVNDLQQRARERTRVLKEYGYVYVCEPYPPFPDATIREDLTDRYLEWRNWLGDKPVGFVYVRGRVPKADQIRLQNLFYEAFVVFLDEPETPENGD